ncbi:hypothetical protein [Polymorphum gilvum]|uniref:Uncharacterized protein n=1 Tax=Polymorphum gilvum (strain LMG 25793 / CGMCC 1.9160 / SL003B-26A1) TaxID=991905 RepID=F2J045_POLGS|nr:hypothetical protein [Polymorphum gilvum]ADZ71880.1 hypothetical protein SL003B_3458 [Polymorphum gilvum SL003B-26A1]
MSAHPTIADACALADATLADIGLIGPAAADDAASIPQNRERLVLARLSAMPFFGGLPTHLPPLSPDERRARLDALVALWASGCPRAIDERLFADLLERNGSRKRLRSR